MHWIHPFMFQLTLCRYRAAFKQAMPSIDALMHLQVMLRGSTCEFLSENPLEKVHMSLLLQKFDSVILASLAAS